MVKSHNYFLLSSHQSVANSTLQPTIKELRFTVG